MTSISEPETLAELISDCADIPEGLRAQPAMTPRPEAPEEWTVSETCHAQVAGLDEY